MLLNESIFSGWVMIDFENKKGKIFSIIAAIAFISITLMAAIFSDGGAKEEGFFGILYDRFVEDPRSVFLVLAINVVAAFVLFFLFKREKEQSVPDSDENEAE